MRPSPVAVARIAAWTNGADGSRRGAGPGVGSGHAARRAGGDLNGRASALSDLPYRPNVGAVLFNRDGLVLVARRADLPNAEGPAGGWQLPQGGIDEGENPREAVLRELAEEIGTDRAEVIGEHDAWLTYDLPPELIGVALKGRYRGQRQRWFALRFTGEDRDIRLDLDPHPEFDALGDGGLWRIAGARGAVQAVDL